MVTMTNVRIVASWGTAIKVGTPDYTPGTQIYAFNAIAGWLRARADATGALIVAGAPGAVVLTDIEQYLGVACSPANPIDVRDTGVNTNPRRYEKDNGFFSNAIAVVGPAATELWGVATGRTAGQITTIYSMIFSNNTGGAATVWLEIAAAAITAPYPIANGQVLVIDFPAGFNSGNADVDVNASVAGVVGQVTGTEV